MGPAAVQREPAAADHGQQPLEAGHRELLRHGLQRLGAAGWRGAHGACHRGAVGHPAAAGGPLVAAGCYSVKGFSSISSTFSMVFV